MSDWIHASVEAMYRDGQAPTAPLREFLEDFDRDDNVWWMIGSGHHLNLFESAVEKIEELRQWQTEMLAWQKAIGFAMTREESNALRDLYQRAGVEDETPEDWREAFTS